MVKVVGHGKWMICWSNSSLLLYSQMGVAVEEDWVGWMADEESVEADADLPLVLVGAEG